MMLATNPSQSTFCPVPDTSGMSPEPDTSIIGTNDRTSTTGHIPVMLSEVLSCLDIRDNGLYLDGTFGGGGYSRAILQAGHVTLHAIDRDPTAIARGQSLIAEYGGRLHLHQGTFGEMNRLVGRFGLFDGIVLDLGVSSFQLDEGARGFSFRHDGPLDMRMSAKGRSAADWVNEEKEETLATILYRYGEEKRSRRIARALVQARMAAPIKTTLQLAEIIRQAVPRERPGFDPATRSFQALRIAVNNELGELEQALAAAPGLLAPGGIFAVVTFHSLEDRMVKQAMAKYAGRNARPSRHLPAAQGISGQTGFDLAYSRPLSPGPEELQRNPRSRSARLRVLRRNETGSTGVVS